MGSPGVWWSRGAGITAADMGVACIARPRSISLGMRCMVAGIGGRLGMRRLGMVTAGGMVGGTVRAGMAGVIGAGIVGAGGGIDGGR